MHPSRPSSTDPNSAYRATLADNQGLAHQANNDPVPAEHAQPQANSLAGLSPRRNNKRDRLKPISHHLGSSDTVALERMGQQSVTEPSASCQPAVKSANITDANISTLRQYFHRMGLNFSSQLQDSTIRSRLQTANLSMATLIAAIDIAHTPNHPTLAAFNANENERHTVISCLAGCMHWKKGFNQQTITASLNADNNPDDLIAGLLLQLRNVR